MAAMWDHQFCLGCDKQVQADNDVYCSEACRLADLEKPPYYSSTPSSQASSPGLAPATFSWSSASTSATSPSNRSSSSRTKFYLSPAYDFSNAQPYGTTPAQPSYLDSHDADLDQHYRSSTRTARLSPSSSHSSLCSMQSTTTSNEEGSQLSAKARKELRAYAVSFEQVRLQRRRSY